MREIKFRGKRSWNGRWIYGNLVIDSKGEKHILEPEVVDMDGHHLYIDDDSPSFFEQDTFGQFTGLHDKNGVEIYEGDLVKFDLYKGNGWENCYEISYYGGGFIISAGGFTGANLRYWNDKAPDIEVIGNIYENTELVKP